MSIPKIIHYCWFGPKPIPESELKCIESWGKFFPDYEFKFWNENTFDINAYAFSRQAYESKYYAFVSDFVRAVVLKQYGGIYLDTDMEILSSITSLLEGNQAVLGFENKTQVGTAIMAFVPNHDIMIDFANYYYNSSFINSSGNLNITANPSILAEILFKYNILLNGSDQKVRGVHVFHRDVFFPKKMSEYDFRVTDKTLSIHHFNASWLTSRQRSRGQNVIWIEICRPVLKRCRKLLFLLCGSDCTRRFETKIRNILK